jgi:hypothetical protein
LVRVFICLFLLLGLALGFWEVEGLAVKLVDVEVVLLCEEAISSYFEQFGGLQEVVLQILAEVGEQVGALLHKASHLPHDFFHDAEPPSLLPNPLEFHFFYIPHNHLVDLQELFENGAMLQFQHNPHELTQLARFLIAARALFEQFPQRPILGGENERGDILFLVPGFAGEEKATLVLDILFLGFALLEFLGFGFGL